MLWGLILLSGIFFLPESPYVLSGLELARRADFVQTSPPRYGQGSRSTASSRTAEQRTRRRPASDRAHGGARVRHQGGERGGQGDVDGVLLNAQYVVEAHVERHDAPVYPAAEWPELLL